ncbi:MAG: MBL fold metallo-hydrolase, partial [Dehalococcoidia bacterium]|nr:MBL fold metallo-hydrolase [Dehalococcoidia bacterium]
AASVQRSRGERAEPSRSPRLRWTLAAAGVLGLMAVFAWSQTLSQPDERLRVSVLDVGQGDAILIETPDGRRILVDGGPSGSVLLQRLGEELPASAHRIALVVLTHGQDDHVTGLVSLFGRYEIEAALVGPLQGESAAYHAWQEELQRRDVRLHQAAAGEWADLGGGVRLEVLGPPRELIGASGGALNDNSVVLRLIYGGVSFLLTGDIEAAGERALMAGGGALRSTVLKVAHHGSDGSTASVFLDAISPEVAVISAGEDNTYGHPSPTTLLRLAGVPFLRTDENGSARFVTDGRRLWLDFERGEVRTIPIEALAK